MGPRREPAPWWRPWDQQTGAKENGARGNRGTGVVGRKRNPWRANRRRVVDDQPGYLTGDGVLMFLEAL